jgi:ankyrin repeat protein
MRAANLNRSAGIASLLKAVNIDLNLRDGNGATALHHGAVKNHIKVVEQLLAAGADPNVLDNNARTAAQRAQLSGYSRLAQQIREHRG